MITTDNYGGYEAVKCVMCGNHGWKGQVQHKKDCPVKLALDKE